MTDNDESRQRGESGQFVEKNTLDDVLDVFTRVRGPIITTSDVADALDCTTEAARQKLRRLTDQGRVDRRKTGRTTVYWRSGSAAEDADTVGDHADADDVAAATAPAAPSPAPAASQEDDESDLLAGVQFPDGRDRETSVAAVYAARDYLRDHGPATMREIVREVMPDHPVGYDVEAALAKVTTSGGRYRGGWWRNIVKPGLKALDDVERPPRGKSDWTYTGGE